MLDGDSLIGIFQLLERERGVKNHGNFMFLIKINFFSNTLCISRLETNKKSVDVSFFFTSLYKVIIIGIRIYICISLKKNRKKLSKDRIRERNK